MRWVLAVLLGTALAVAHAPVSEANQQLLFAYFKNNGDTGVYFAISPDGYRWRTLNHGSPWIAPGLPGELMRDAYITRSPDGHFHMVWTWDWKGTCIGYAHSADLIHWSDQIQVPLMDPVPGTEHTWAPEIYWDAPKGQWLVIWSSVVAGRHTGNRIYNSFTRDFKSFSKPSLFFDPGFDAIDATIFQTRGKFYLIFKDERSDPLKKQIRLATANSLEGPYSNVGDPLTETWSEGPSAIQFGNNYFVYYDHYRKPQRYSAVASVDMTHWSPLAGQLAFPEGARHGSFLKLTDEEAKRLED